MLPFLQRRRNPFQHTFDVGHDVVVPEPEHSEALSLEPPGAQGVGFRVLGMLAAVQFDDQFCRVTGEVRDIRADLNLPPELGAIQPPIGPLEKSW